MLENLVHKKFAAQMPYFKDLFKQFVHISKTLVEGNNVNP